MAGPCPSQQACDAGRLLGLNICVTFAASLAQTLSLKPVLKDHPSPVSLPRPFYPLASTCSWHRTSFLLPLFTISVISVSHAPLLLSVPCQMCFPHSNSLFSFIPSLLFCAPGKCSSLQLGCFMPFPSSLPNFCWFFLLTPPCDLLH